jgi:predicted nucleic acid-binding protein
MNADEFLDTSILLYAYAPGHPEKQTIAQELMQRGGGENLVVSTQVLAEFASALLHKTSPVMHAEAVAEMLDAVGWIRVVGTDTGTVRRAVEARAQYGVHFYDGMIIAAAERARCARIWSEDLNPGQTYFGVRVENPFQ